mgnify:CR=1 FL=1
MKMLEACVRSRLTYGTQTIYIGEAHMKKLKSSWIEMLRHLVKGGWARLSTPEGSEEEMFSLKYRNEDILAITKSKHLDNVVRGQYLRYIGHVCRSSNTMLTNKMLFAKSKKPYQRDPWINISKMLKVSIEQAKRETQVKSGFAALIQKQFGNATPWQQDC